MYVCFFQTFSGLAGSSHSGETFHVTYPNDVVQTIIVSQSEEHDEPVKSRGKNLAFDYF